MATYSVTAYFNTGFNSINIPASQDVVELATKKLFVDEYGLGLHISDPLKVKKLVENFISNPALLEKYIKNCKKFKEYGTGEKEIADAIYRKLTETAK